MTRNESGLPFDDFKELLDKLPEANLEIQRLTAEQVSQRLGEEAGNLGEICSWYSAWSGRSPVIGRPVLTLFAGTHAVDPSRDEELVSEVTEISQGSAAINRLCHENNLGLKVLDLALQIPVADITKEAALDEKSCAGTIAFGMEAIAGGADLLCVSAIGSRLDTSALALLSILTQTEVAELAVQCSLESSAPTVSRARMAVERAEKFESSPLELLRHLGGRETAAICGALLAARSQHVPVLVSGYTALACMLLLARSNPMAVKHCQVAQKFNASVLNEACEQVGVAAILPEGTSGDAMLQLAISAQIIKSAGLAWQQRPMP